MAKYKVLPCAEWECRDFGNPDLCDVYKDAPNPDDPKGSWICEADKPDAERIALALELLDSNSSAI